MQNENQIELTLLHVDLVNIFLRHSLINSLVIISYSL